MVGLQLIKNNLGFCLVIRTVSLVLRFEKLRQPVNKEDLFFNFSISEC